MSYELAMLTNWLMVGAGLLASDTFSGLFDDLFKGDDAAKAVQEEEITPLGDNLGLGDGNDTYVGTDEGDFVLGQAGDDEIDGGAGDDTLEGTTGDDILTGGAGVRIWFPVVMEMMFWQAIVRIVTPIGRAAMLSSWMVVKATTSCSFQAKTLRRVALGRIHSA
ncbi:calcium-binding protein [Octadecabacter ascidiaceicola]|uniref:Leukotoxin n=1 Tax=Octadecabacter ascidiaceicola TaxID=1655543 RepID=A0A238JN77_9RHOB|nr:calcium-binding protein [Octadecabacter ascidiaceicola]SMX31664.1 Leukotoxin [Octadecabacter ascidiaceicola]